MKAKFSIQRNDFGTPWLVMEMQDKDGRWLYRSKRLVNENDIYRREFDFDFPDQIVDYTDAWKDKRRMALQEIKYERANQKSEEWLPF